jgi:hypothetical protein
MTLQQFIAANRSTANVNGDIRERWNSRVVPNGWEKQGATGADNYIAQYGKNIGTPKLCALAMLAEDSGAQLMGARFWELAFQKEGGAGAPAPAPAAAKPVAPKAPAVDGLPIDLQPRVLTVTKDVKSKLSAKKRVEDSASIGFALQPGKRFVIFGSGDKVVFSPELAAVDKARFGNALTEAAKMTGLIQGPFIVEVIASLVAKNNTLADELQSVADSGKTRLTIFPALFAGKLDLRNELLSGRVAETENLTAYLEAGLAQYSDDDTVTCSFAPAATPEAKANLIARAGGNEGEAWFDADGKRSITKTL